jgi:hypothetical protein
MKYFVTSAEMSWDQHGVSDYMLSKDVKKTNVCIMRGTFTATELRALADALDNNNLDFELPETFVPKH